MTVFFHPKAEEELDAMDSELRKRFFKHIEKVAEMPQRRHLKSVNPHHVEEVTKQARLVYDKQENNVEIHHCFSTHKDYEKWYKSFK